MSVREGRSQVSFWILAVVLQLQLNYFLTVSSDFRVVDKWSNAVVFQTGSDFVRTGCGSFLNRSQLVISEPLDACTVPKGPPKEGGGGFLSKLYDALFEEPTVEKTQFVLVASGEGCDLKEKFRNAASAGYAGIIVGTEEVHEDIIQPGVFTEDDEEFIDVHLVNPLDIRVLSKGYAYPNQYLVDPPCLTRCKEEYQRTWLRSRYVAIMLRAWKRFMGMSWELIKLLLLIAGTTIRGLNSIVPFLFHARDTFSSIAMYLASIFFSIAIGMMVSTHLTYKKITKYQEFVRRASVTEEERKRTTSSSSDSQPENDFRDRREQQWPPTSSTSKSYPSSFDHIPPPQPSRRPRSPSPSPGYSSTYASYDHIPPPRRPRSPSPSPTYASYDHIPPPLPPRRPRSPSPTPPTNRVPIDYTRYHRIKLEMKLNEPLTRARVNSAYRELALKYHPDKNLHLDAKQRTKLTEEFREITKSRETLLSYCLE